MNASSQPGHDLLRLAAGGLLRARRHGGIFRVHAGALARRRRHLHRFVARKTGEISGKTWEKLREQFKNCGNNRCENGKLWKTLETSRENWRDFMDFEGKL